MRNADVLDRILAGEQVEAASQEVRELAQLASVLQSAWGDGPTKAATSRTRTAVLAAFEENGNGSSPAATPVRVVPISRGRRLVARMALAAALVVGLPVTAFAASEDALPGQLLYPVKRGFEEVRLALAGDPVDEARVLLNIAGERVEETVLAAGLGLDSVAQLARDGYDEAVARFEGRIVEAQALGLPVQGLLDEAADLFAGYQQVFDAIFGPPPAAPAPGPTEVLSAKAPPGQVGAADKGDGDSKGAKASKKRGGGGGHKRDGSKAHRGDGDNAGSGDSGGSGQVGGSAGGGNGGGGDAGAAGGDDDGDDGDDEGGDEGDDEGDDQGDDHDDHEDGEGRGLGHEKAIGEGHQKDNGEGHSEDG